MTKWNCESCGKEQWSGITSHAKLCPDCATIQNRCYWCGDKHHEKTKAS